MTGLSEKENSVIDPLALIAEVDRLSRRELWPGFDTRSTPLAVYTGQRTLLFRHPAPPAGFVTLAEKDDSYSCPGRHPLMRANTTVDLGGIPTATVLLDGHGRESLADLAALVIHEMFHVFQDARHPDWGANEAELFVYPMEDVDLLGLRRLETEALRRALGTSGAAVAGWSASALELRYERFGRLPEGSVAYERGTELKEGLATYVEYRATSRRVGPELPEGGFAAEDVRGRCYAVGHAFAVLLDGLAPGWQRHLEEGESISLDELLGDALRVIAAEPIRFNGSERAATYERARSDIDVLGRERRQVRDGFLTHPGWRIEVETGAEPLWPEGFDPSRVRRLGTGEVLHERWLKLGNRTGSLEVLDREALTEAVGPHPLFNGVRRITLTGVSSEPRIRKIGDTTAIEAEGFTGRFRRAHQECNARCLVLRLGKA